MARTRTSSIRSPAPVAPGSARLEAALCDQQQRIAAAIEALDAAGVEDVHRARVAARRLRSMLKTFAPLLDPRRRRRYRADLRRLARALGAARESDVRRELLVRTACEDKSLAAAERERLTALLDGACAASREQLRRSFREPSWQSLCHSLARDAAGRSLVAARDAEMAELARLAAQAWRRPVKILRRKPTTTAELHQLRLAFKHCRYGLEPIATEIAPKASSRLLRRLRAAQDRIGDHRDAILAGHWVRENERALGRTLVARLAEDLHARERRLRRQAAVRAARVLEAWRAWRDATRRIRKAARRDRA